MGHPAELKLDEHAGSQLMDFNQFELGFVHM